MNDIRNLTFYDFILHDIVKSYYHTPCVQCVPGSAPLGEGGGGLGYILCKINPNWIDIGFRITDGEN